MVVGSSIFQVKLRSTVQELAPVFDPTSEESRRPCDPERPSLHEWWSMDMCKQFKHIVYRKMNSVTPSSKCNEQVILMPSTFILVATAKEPSTHRGATLQYWEPLKSRVWIDNRWFPPPASCPPGLVIACQPPWIWPFGINLSTKLESEMTPTCPGR